MKKTLALLKIQTAKTILLVSILGIITGCIGTSANLNKVSIGMKKSEVLAVIGPADSVSAIGNMEYLIYHWASPKQLIADENNLPRYYVRLIDGVVDAYGRMGDFDSTKDPRKVIVEREDKIQADINMSGSSESDMYSELMKIKQLKDEGLLTEEEFQTEKKEILEKY